MHSVMLLLVDWIVTADVSKEDRSFLGEAVQKAEEEWFRHAQNICKYLLIVAV